MELYKTWLMVAFMATCATGMMATTDDESPKTPRSQSIPNFNEIEDQAVFDTGDTQQNAKNVLAIMTNAPTKNQVQDHEDRATAVGFYNYIKALIPLVQQPPQPQG